MSYQNIFYLFLGIGFVLLTGTTILFFPKNTYTTPAAVNTTIKIKYPNFNLLDRNPRQEKYGTKPTPQF